MGLSVECIDETGKLQKEDLALIQNVLLFAAKFEKLDDRYELAVTIVSDEIIQQLNNEYRGQNEATDVLSFSLLEAETDELEIVGSEAPKLLGDIVISHDRVVQQAEDYGHLFQRELGFLVIHGFLHLLGYEHETKVDEMKMFTKQAEILNQFGLQRHD